MGLRGRPTFLLPNKGQRSRSAPGQTGIIDFFRTRQASNAYFISGVTRDSAGTALPGCVVDLFDQISDTKQKTTRSDLVTGAYSFQVGATAGPFYGVGYKPGLPDVAGVTVETLFGSSISFD